VGNPLLAHTSFTPSPTAYGRSESWHWFPLPLTAGKRAAYHE
jgi:hypothetical protein